MILFVAAFETRAEVTCTAQGLRVQRHGQAKFVPKVREISFCAAQALRAGKCVLYVTHYGLFQLERVPGEGEVRGRLVLIAVFPGIDVQRDIVDASPARIALPTGGARAVEVRPNQISI